MKKQSILSVVVLLVLLAVGGGLLRRGITAGATGDSPLSPGSGAVGARQAAASAGLPREKTAITSGQGDALWVLPAATKGEPLDVNSTAYVTARLQGKVPVGRTVLVSEAGALSLDALQKGHALSIPLPDGSVLQARVNFTQAGPDGAVRVGGSLTAEPGGFSLARVRGIMAGRILLPDRGLAYLVEALPSGLIQLRELALRDVICFPIPGDGAVAAVPGVGPVAAMPVYRSRPEATAVLYLDFDGAVVTDPDWHNGNTITAAAAVLNTSQITEIAYRVGEDFIPFGINVTTVEGDYTAAAVGRRMRVIITPTKEWYGNVGGVAYVDSFARAGTDFTSDVPAWVFNSTVNTIAEAISHELGHTLGLSHDGRVSPPEEYYSGNGSGAVGWGPIMGVAYDKTLSQWSKGEYTNASNLEDDIAILAGDQPTPLTGATNPTGHVADDYGNTNGTAFALIGNGTSVYANGMLGPGDTDVFTVTTTTGGDIYFTATSGFFSGNADIALTLYDGAGNYIYGVNPSNATTVFLHGGTLPPGTYYVHVSGAGYGNPFDAPPSGYTAYGSLGAYMLAGTVRGLAPGAPLVTIQPVDRAAITGEEVSFSGQASGNPLPSYQWQRLPAGGSVWETITSGGDYTVSNHHLTVSNTLFAMSGDQFRFVATNSAGSVTSSPATLTVSGPPGFLQPPRTRSVLLGQPVTFTATTSSGDAVSYVWKRRGQTIPGVTGNTLSIAEAALGDQGFYEVVASNSSGSTSSFFHLNVMPAGLTALVWGANDSGQKVLPAGLSDLLAISAGIRHILALRSDGTVLSWGETHYGQGAIPVGLDNVAAIAAGWNPSLALKNDGTVVGWGDGAFGSTGPGAVIPAGLKNIISIAAGTGSGFGLKADGTVISWGFTTGSSPPTGLNRVVAIAAGPYHKVALKADGTVAAWGGNSDGESTVPDGLTDVVAVAGGGLASDGFSLALRADGTVVAWGSNRQGQCAVPVGLSGVVAIAAGARTSYALKGDGSIIAWGENAAGELTIPALAANAKAITAGYGFGVALIVGEPPGITVPPASRTVTVGDSVAFSVTATGSVPLNYQWMRNGADLANDSRISGTTTPNLQITGTTLADAGNYTVRVSNSNGSIVSDPGVLSVGVVPLITQAPQSRVVLEGQPAAFAISVAGAGTYTYQWRHNRQLIAGATSASFNRAAATFADRGLYEVLVTGPDGGVARSIFHLQVAVPNVRLVAWGEYPPSLPVLSGSVAAIDGGDSSPAALALMGDGTLLAWGQNDHGQTTIPVGLDRVVGMSVGLYHCLAVRDDGTVVGWGNNSLGQTNIPANLANVVAVAAGHTHSLALKSDGTVVGWGTSDYGQHVVPADLKNVVAITTGRFTSVALKGDGTVVQWSYDFSGGHVVPPGLGDVVAIAGGGSLGYALKADETVVGWGWPSATVPAGLAAVRSIDSGLGTLAVKADGTVVGWDSNHNIVPAGLADVLDAKTVSTSFVALVRSRPPAITGQPVAQTAVVGDYVTMTVTANGPTPITYQWRRNGTNLADAGGVTGTTSPTLVIDGVQALHEGAYDVVVANGEGNVPSDAVTLTVKVPPVFTQRPLSRVGLIGQPITLSAAISDPGTVTYQWKHNGEVIVGSNGPSLTIPSLSAADAGWYEIVAANAVAARSSYFRLKVISGTTANLKVVAWGYNQYSSGPTLIPAGLQSVVDIAAGENHAVALKSDGTITTWGLNSFGQSSVPSGLSEVVAVAAGAYHTLALRADGTVVSWGSYSGAPSAPPAGLRSVVAIAAKQTTNLALKADGTVLPWTGMAVPDGLNEVTAIAVGGGRALALKRDGTVVGWGESSGVGRIAMPGGLSGVVAIGAGDDHSIVAKSDGSVVAWGWNDFTQATPSAGLTGTVAVSGGYIHGIALQADGSVLGWGHNGGGQASPAPVADIKMIASANTYNLGLVPVAALSAQTITFAALPDRVLSSGPITLSATASSGLTVDYIVVSGPATISGNQLTLTGPGTVTVRASQAGDATYAAATPVDRSFVVTGNFSTWLSGKFTAGELLDANISGPNADPDGDGYSNLLEYALGLEPKSSSSTGLPEMSTSATDWIYTYTRPADRAELTYTVEVSSDLATWTTGGVTHELVSTASGSETWRARYPLGSAANVFFRLKTDQP